MTEPPVRRVVSATSADGFQTFVRDGNVKPVRFDGSHPQSLMYPLWGLDHPPSMPADGSQFDYRSAVAPPLRAIPDPAGF